MKAIDPGSRAVGGFPAVTGWLRKTALLPCFLAAFPTWVEGWVDMGLIC